MKKLLTAVLPAIIFCSCQQITGSGNIITQTRHVNQFDGVRTSSSIDIEVTNGNSQSVSVEADDNIMPYIITNVENGMLDVHFKNNVSYRNVNVKVYVSAPVLSRLFVSGSGTIISKNTLTAENHIQFRISGSGDIKAAVDAPSTGAE